MKKREIQEFEPGDMLTKLEVCQLFCKKLNIGKSTYYKKIYPWLKFHPIEKDISGYRGPQKGVERMPFSIAVGIINKMTGNMQNDDPPSYELSSYLE